MRNYNYVSTLTKKRLQGKQVVIVRFSDTNCLTFLVDDCESPQVPGYPARSLSRYKSMKSAREAIARCYKKHNYYPKHYEPASYWSKKQEVTDGR